jgi:hypothetical protein
VLNNIDGIYLTEETCKPEILEALTQDSDKSSVFWLEYTDHNGAPISTEKKIWIQNFQVMDPALGIGKTDFNFKLRMNERPSFSLIEWMKKDLMLELWETRPKLIEKRNDETFEVTKEVVIGLSGTPEIEKKIRGVRIIKRQ